MIQFWAEAGPCDNSIDQALKYAQAAYDGGASALKVQWYNADKLVVPGTPRYDKTSGPHTDQHAMFANSIYPYDKWKPVIDFCNTIGLGFIPSIFDFEGIDVANEFELPLLKIASGDLTYLRLIAAASDGRQVALSTGASTYDEVKMAVSSLSLDADHILMSCHLEYPTPYERANIARTFYLQSFFPWLVPGFSDHTPGIDTIPLIVASGCQVIEKHFCLVRGEGYDSDFALTPDELTMAIAKIQGTLAVMGDSDLTPDVHELAAREGARRSPYAAHDIPAGTLIDAKDMVLLRPDYGIYPWEVGKILGRSFEHDISKLGQFPIPD